ncbi:22010_t:CDS:2, partial [Racocetra persica]
PTYQNDIYSFGILLNEIMTGLSPHHNITIKRLIARCSDSDPTRRPKIDELNDILRHMNFETIEKYHMPVEMGNHISNDESGNHFQRLSPLTVLQQLLRSRIFPSPKTLICKPFEDHDFTIRSWDKPQYETMLGFKACFPNNDREYGLFEDREDELLEDFEYREYREYHKLLKDEYREHHKLCRERKLLKNECRERKLLKDEYREYKLLEDREY